MVIEERRPGLFVARLKDGTELALAEHRGGLMVTAVEGRLAVFPAVANRVIVAPVLEGP